ncbi:DUF1508 domain-containing protein [Burkholderia sp. SR8]|uniref:DUF1508 domain-containing protein n=1 Tax=Burkholderia sp. SR8 TaxID=3062277 RepID=UPI0040629AF7
MIGTSETYTSAQGRVNGGAAVKRHASGGTPTISPDGRVRRRERLQPVPGRAFCRGGQSAVWCRPRGGFPPPV